MPWGNQCTMISSGYTASAVRQIPAAVIAKQPAAEIVAGPTQETLVAYGDTDSPINYTVSGPRSNCNKLSVMKHLSIAKY